MSGGAAARNDSCSRYAEHSAGMAACGNRMAACGNQNGGARPASNGAEVKNEGDDDARGDRVGVHQFSESEPATVSDVCTAGRQNL